jgi:hypothetical protein
LYNYQGITLDIDATEIIANKSEAQWMDNASEGVMADEHIYWATATNQNKWSDIAGAL